LLGPEGVGENRSVKPVEYHLLKEAGVDDEGEPTKIRCSCGWQWRRPRDDHLGASFKPALKAHLAAFGIDSNPAGIGMPNTDLVETWQVTTADQAAHFGLPWNGGGYRLLLLNQRQKDSHASMVLPMADRDVAPVEMAEDGRPVYEGGQVDFRPGWPTEWPEHDTSNCGGHGEN
jgi:hypothetical protein